MRGKRIVIVTALWCACLLGAIGLVVHTANASMDNPIPPVRPAPVARHPSPELTKGTGYCVSVNLDGEFYGKVQVPLHKPDKDHLDELRLSIGNAYRLVALQQTDPIKAANLREAANHIQVPGDPVEESVKRQRPGDPPPPVVVGCICASGYTPGVVPGPGCGGICGDCYLCIGGKGK